MAEDQQQHHPSLEASPICNPYSFEKIHITRKSSEDWRLLGLLVSNKAQLRNGLIY